MGTGCWNGTDHVSVEQPDMLGGSAVALIVRYGWIGWLVITLDPLFDKALC